MSTKRYKPEQIVNLLRQLEVELANGKTTPQACLDAGRSHGPHLQSVAEGVRRVEARSGEATGG
jgi:hypothetical protein